MEHLFENRICKCGNYVITRPPIVTDQVCGHCWKQSQEYDNNILTNIPVSSVIRPTDIILRFQGLTMRPNKNTKGQ